MLYKNLLTWLLILGTLSSCALQNTSTGLTKYQQAMLCYESQNYSEALRFFEEAAPLLRGKKEEASAYFHQAYCSFYKKKYVQGSDRFQFFCKTFPRDPRVEEAMYMQGHALYLESPDVNLDQAYTQEAAQALRGYLDSYPGGAYVHEANIQLGELDNKFALKAFNSAKLYHQLAHYRAAVVTLQNFQKDFPDSLYNEEAAYLKVDAQYCYCKEVEKTNQHVGYDLEVIDYYKRNDIFQDNGIPYNGKKSVDTLEEDVKALKYYRYFKSVQEVDAQEQLRIAIEYCQEFIDNYPNGHRALAVGKIYESLLPVNKP
jgi:outer membrane protein assembly factor BamD